MKMSNYKSRPKSKYSTGAAGVPVDYDAVHEKKKRRTFKQWLRDYLKEESSNSIYEISDSTPTNIGHSGFNKSFEGWNIRLHRANGGHIVEAWKNEDGPQSHNYKPQHELFMVQDNEEMGERLNQILVQLMLRG